MLVAGNGGKSHARNIIFGQAGGLSYWWSGDAAAIQEVAQSGVPVRHGALKPPAEAAEHLNGRGGMPFRHYPFHLAEPDEELAMLNGVHVAQRVTDRRSTRLNSSHLVISYAVFCLTKK